MIPKFRAWHHELSRMMLIRTMFFFANELEELQLNDSIMNDDIPVYPDEIELMQSTGLRDKNGKEIFEGDIVTAGDVTSDIKYHQTLGYYMIGKYGFSVPFGQGVDVEYFEEFADHVSKIFEVIGNIYENPELLEVE